jgi:diguanylate cyclase (GGDEF)-like protein
MDKPFALIVEDDRDVAALFRHVIDLSGYRTEVALHGKVAAERLSNSQPDIVILDLNLPGISGVEILEMIHKDRRLRHTRVIVITAHAHIATGLSVQPDLILLKPISVEQLTSFINRFHLIDGSPKVIPMQEKPLDIYTGLYNQPFFLNRLESALKQAREIDGYLFAVFLFTVDPKNKIKAQVDTHYWELTLREIAESLKNLLRPTDTLARFNPNTFYVLIENIPNPEITTLIADRIQNKLAREIKEIEKKVKLPIKVGILLCDSGYNNTEEILSDAKYAQSLSDAQGDEYSKYYYRFSVKKLYATKINATDPENLTNSSSGIRTPVDVSRNRSH